MLEGLPLTEGASLGTPDGWLDGKVLGTLEGAPLGPTDGWLDGIELGSPDTLGLSLGIDVGQSETDGLSEG
jgi:hypothetical protein